MRLPFSIIAVLLVAACSSDDDDRKYPAEVLVHHNCSRIVFFASGSTALSTQSKNILDSVDKGCPAWSQLGPEARIIVRGHTDKVGLPDANIALSLKRAEVVRDYLVAKKLPAAEIVVGAYGDTKPYSGDARDNRRVEIFLMFEGRLCCGPSWMPAPSVGK